jgi:hypothetical protein
MSEGNQPVDTVNQLEINMIKEMMRCAADNLNNPLADVAGNSTRILKLGDYLVKLKRTS